MVNSSIVKTPYFSVITPSFNQGKFLDACIKSVSDQDEEDYEQIIIDNCSTDETEEVLGRYARKSFIKVICESDHGQSEAVNKGFCHAQGEIICWLNSDDAYPLGTFKRLKAIFSNPTINVVFGNVRQISYDGRSPERLEARFHDRDDLIRWWSSKVKLHQPAVFFRRSVQKKIGFLREDLHYAMDYEYWWRMAADYSFHYVNEELAIQHRQPESKTIKAWHHVLEEREKIFSPFYSMLPVDQGLLHQEKKQALARQYLLQAYASLATSRATAWFYLKQAFHESPRLVLKPSSLGLIRQLIT